MPIENDIKLLTKINSKNKFMRKSFLLFFLVWISLAFATAQTSTAPSGTGTSADPYLIANLDNLYWVTQNTASWSGKYFKQTADIDATATSSWAGGAGFTPIGNGTTTFSSSYDGQGYVISGLFINRPTTNEIGFFGKISGNPTIQNIRLVNINVKGQGNVGGLVGSQWDGSANTLSVISNCSATGAVVGAGSSIGGMFGCLGNQAAINVVRCYSTCNVSTSAVSGQNNYGGLAGYVKGGNASTQKVTFTNCYATGNVSANVDAGGFIGGVGTVSGTAGCWLTTNCYSIGLVTVPVTSKTFGFIGRIVSGGVGTVTNCFWDTQTSGQSSSLYGTGKTTAEMKTLSTYASWDFIDETTNGTNDYWVMTSVLNNGYPALTWQSPVAKAATAITASGFTANWGNVPTTNWATAPTLTYVMDVATDAAFTSILTDCNNLSVSGNTQVISGLSGGTTYYYRTRYVYNGLSSSNNSNVITLTTLSGVPVATEATHNTSSGFTANWNSVNGDVKYLVEVATDAEFANIVHTSSLISGTSYAAIGLNTNTAYYYRVRSRNVDGFFSANSNVISTATTAGLAIPVANAAGSIGTDGFTAKWNASAGATEYRLDVATDNEFANLVTGYDNLLVAGTSQVISGLTAGTTYYYRVRAYDGSETSSNSNIITQATTPVAPVANEATGVTTSGFTASWAVVSGATGYLVDVATNSGFTSFVSGYNGKSVAETSLTLSGLPNGTTYYYRVRATNGTVSENSNVITVATIRIYPTIPFANFTVYPDGASSDVYNAGPGLASDQTATTTEDSKMVIINSTSEATFTAYIQSLLSNGFTQISTNRIDNNIFYALTNVNKLYYLYFTGSTNQVRIIQDNSTKTMLSELDASVQGTGKTEFYLYSLDYTHGEGQTSKTDYWKIDCGATLVVKLKDNSLFIVDAGHQRQSSNAAMEGFLNFMYNITGQQAGSTLDIRGWFFSHAHGDHVYFTSPFLAKYHDVLNVETVLFNFPSFQTMSSGYDSGTFLMKQAFNTYYPNCKYVKLHTGQTFTLQGVKFDVLHTHEDGVSSAGKTTIGDFNDTSTILEMTMDGKQLMLLADAGNVCQSDMLAMYSAATLKSDCVQTSHHGYNNIASLYSAIKAPLAMFCNSPRNVSGNATVYAGVVNATSNVKVVYADPFTTKITVVNGSFVTENVPSYRSYFTTVKIPNLTVGTINTSGNKVALSVVPTEASLAAQVIDKSVTGTGSISTGESCSLILDGTTSTKFCTDTIPSTIAWTMKQPVTLKWYVLYTANDNATRTGRSPQMWVLSGSNDGISWTSIDSVSNAQLPEVNFTGTAFAVSNPRSYRYYALKVFTTAGATVLQFSEIGLYGEVSTTTGVVNNINDKESVTVNTIAKNQILVNYNGDLSHETSVSVYNLVGQKLVSDRITDRNTVITVPASGIYIVAVVNSRTKVVRKIRLN